MKGLFLVLEGTDGSGKTTVLEGLKQRFAAEGLDVLYTREPGGPPIAEQIRKILLDTANTAMVPMTEALLYAASRAQHVQEVIRPALEEGRIVFSDRFLLSSLAYQGVARGLGLDTVEAINRYATGGLSPDLTLFLDVDPVVVLARKGIDAPRDRLEDAGDAFFKNVYNGYMQAISRVDKIALVDASKPPEAVIDEAWQQIERVLRGRREGEPR